MNPPIGFLVRLPLQTKSPNRSFLVSMGGRMAQAKRARAHKTVAHQAIAGTLRSRGITPAQLEPILVTLTRVSAGVLDDDNLRGALKATRDGVALALGLDDGHKDRGRLRFEYAQAPCKRGQYGVEVLVEHDTRRAALVPVVPPGAIDRDAHGNPTRLYLAAAPPASTVVDATCPAGPRIQSRRTPGSRNSTVKR